MINVWFLIGNDQMISLFYMENINSRTEPISLTLVERIFTFSLYFWLIFLVSLNLQGVVINFSGLGKWQIHLHLPTHGSQKYFSSCFHCFAQERDAERRRQLRERARQLIAEARSGVKMSEMSLLDTSGAERGKSSRTSPVAGQHTLLKIYKHTASHFLYRRHSCLLFISSKMKKGHFSMCLTLAGFLHPHIPIMLSKGVLYNPQRKPKCYFWHQPWVWNPPPSHLQQQFTPRLPSRLIRPVIVNQQNTLCVQIILKIPNTSNNGSQRQQPPPCIFPTAFHFLEIGVIMIMTIIRYL